MKDFYALVVATFLIRIWSKPSFVGGRRASCFGLSKTG